MNQSGQTARRVAVVGGGISGLAAAHRLLELDPTAELTLWEAGDRLGGVLETIRQDGFLIERSADNFVTNVPWGIDLCRRLGLADQLLTTDPRFRQALVVRDGRLLPVPQGFALMAPTRIGPMLATGILSPWGKLRMLGELFVPPRQSTADESLASFVRRRFGRELFDRLVQPLVGGIYTADPEQLSLAATMPRFQQMERRSGSLIVDALQAAAEPSGAEHSARGARYSLFVAPREGMASLTAALAARLPAGAARLGAPIERIERDGARWRVAPARGEAQTCDAVIVAAPAPVAARLLATVDGALSAELGRIVYAGASLVVAGYRREQFPRPIDAFGIVVPAVERRRVLAISFSSVKYAHRAPDDCVLLRVFVGGACQPELAELPDEALRAAVREELAELLGVRGEPALWHVARWRGAMPQYHVGHCERVARIESLVAALPGLALAGNAYRGVGVPHCIHSGEEAAQRALGRR